MSKKPIFNQIILLIIIGILGIVLTVALARWAGSSDDILLFDVSRQRSLRLRKLEKAQKGAKQINQTKKY